MRPGSLKKFGGKLMMKSYACLFRVEGDEKINSFEHSPTEEYRRENATTEEVLMWKQIKKLWARGKGTEL